MNQLDYIAENQRLREEIERLKACDCFERNPQWLVSNGNGVYEEYIYKYCPLCGRKLNGDEQNDRP